MSDTTIILSNQSAELARQTLPPLELAIAAWLDAKGKRSGSARTLQEYRSTLADFRSALLSHYHIDLDGDPRKVRLMAQVWAGYSKKPPREVKPTTFNLRLAILSSFYKFARKNEFLYTENPIEKIERRQVQGYGNAQAIPSADLKKQLGQIDRSSVEGKRDYALLAVALETGHRASELAALTRGDLTGSDRYTVVFKRCKGGKRMVDTLTTKTTKALVEYLYAAHGPDFLTMPATTPLWISFSPRNKGKGISIQTVADICERHLGTSKIHTLRHTFAHMMDEAGAPASVTQARLGHESLATTGRYLASLKRAENPHADAIADMLGIGD